MKKHSYRKQLSILLVIALVVTSFPSYVLANTGSPDQATSEKSESLIKYDPNYKGKIEIVEELPFKRGEFEKHFVNTDGSMIAVSYPEAVHYQVNGTWEDIDSRLVVKDKDKGLYGPAASDLQVLLPGSATADILVPATKSEGKDSIIKLSSNYLTKVTDGEYSISWNILGNSKDYTSDFLSKASSKTLDKALVPVSAMAKNPQPDFSNLSHDEQKTALPNLISSATYKNIIKNVDVTVTVTPDKLKENLIINSPKGFESVSYLINAGNLEGAISEDNSVTFTNDKDEVVFRIPKPYMFDSKTFPDDSFDIALALSKTSGGYLLTMTPNSDWISDPSRVFPVTLDPTVTTTKSEENITDTYIHSGDSAGDHYAAAPVKIGETEGASCRGYFKFISKPTIDTNKNYIIGGDFIGYLYSGTSTYHNMTIYQPTSAWGSTTLEWSNRPSNTAAISTKNAVLSGSYYKYTFPVDDSVKTWYETGVNYGYMIKYTDESISDYNWFYSSDHPTISTSYYPCLTVEYAADTTAPTLSVSPASSTTWKNADVTLTATATDSGVGVNTSSYLFNNAKSTLSPISTYKVTTNGMNTIGMSVKDKAGNQKTISTKVYLDKTLPTLGSITAFTSSDLDAHAIPLPGYSTVTSPVIKLNGLADTYSGLNTSGITYAIRATGSTATLTYQALPSPTVTPVGGLTSVSSAIPIPADGSYNIYFSIKDNAGNATATTPYITYTLDRTAPTLGSISLTPTTTAQSRTTDTSPTISVSSITDTNFSKTYYSVDNNPYVEMALSQTTYGTKELPTNTVTSAGEHFIRVKAVDKAGNETISSPMSYFMDDGIVLSESAYLSPVSLTNYYGKNIISWKSVVPLPSQVYYNVYRGTTSDFVVDSSSLLAADLKTSYYVDMTVGTGTTYYYKVKVLKKAADGTEQTPSFVSAQAVSGVQLAATDLSQNTGSQFYMDYFTFGTPVGSGAVEKRFGNLSYTQQDFGFSNAGLEYGLTRTYNSMNQSTGMLGKGWSDSYHMELYTASGKMYLRMGDGTVTSFTTNGGSYSCDQSKEYALTANAALDNKNRKYVVTMKDGTEYGFNSFGQVLRIDKPTKEALFYSYDPLGRLASVASMNIAEQAERTINLTYASSTSYALSKIVLPDATERNYNVASGQLSSVTYSRGGFTGGGTTASVVFELSYDSSGLLNLIKDGELNSYAIEYADGKASKITYPNNEYYQFGYTTDGNGNAVCTVNKKYGSSLIYSDQSTQDFSTGKVLSRTDASGVVTEYSYLSGSSENHLLVNQITSRKFYETLDLGSGLVAFASQPTIETRALTYNSNENVTIEDVTSTVGGATKTETTTTTYQSTGNTNLTASVTSEVNDTVESQTSYTYSPDGRVTNETVDMAPETPLSDVGKTETSYTYSEADGSEALGITTTVEKDAATVETSSSVLDGDGNPVLTGTETGGTEQRDASTYDVMGRLLTQEDASGKTTAYSYDFLGRVISTTISQEGFADQTTSSSYNKNGSLASSTDVLGTTTAYTFDSINREITRAVSASGITGSSSSTSYGYEYYMSLPNQVGTPAIEIAYKETTTENGVARTKWTNGKGNLVKETSGGVTQYFRYDNSGNQVLEFTQDGTDVRASMSLYNEKGECFAAIQNPAISTGSPVTYTADSSSILTRTLYYDNGKIKAQIDGKGVITHFTYDTMDRVTGIREDAVLDGSGNLQTGGVQNSIAYPDQFTTTCTDGASVVSTRIVDESGQTTTSKTGTGTSAIQTAFEYDIQGRIVKETYSDASFKSYVYNDKGLLIEVTTTIPDAQNNNNPIVQTKAAYTYNSKDQLESEIDYKLDAAEELVAYHYAYYEYDNLGRMTGAIALNQEAVPTDSEKASHKTVYAYNTAGQITQVTYPQNTADEVKGIKYLYDASGRIEYVKAVVGMTDKTLRQYVYNGFGNVSSIKDYADFTGSGAKRIDRTYSYDTFGRVTSMQYVQGTTTLESFALTYDSNSNITKEIDGNITKEYTYDNLGDLTKVKTTHGQNSETTSYEYNSAGNRTSKETATTRNEYVYNSLNQLTSMVEKNKVNGQFQQVASTAYTYDAKGNLTQDSETRGGANTVVNNTYTVDSMLSGTSIQVGANNTLTQANAYNGSGQRIAKDENGTLTNYFYQGSSVLYTTDFADAKTSQNFLSPVGSAIATARYAPTDISYYLYNKDIRNSTASIVNETAGFATKYSYDEYGITTVDGSYTFANEICYTGGIYDWALGQYYLNARFYDPQLGRFLSEDTYRGETNYPNSWHLYAYCANNPINYVDPSGHIGIPVDTRTTGRYWGDVYKYKTYYSKSSINRLIAEYYNDVNYRINEDELNDIFKGLKKIKKFAKSAIYYQAVWEWIKIISNNHWKRSKSVAEYLMKVTSNMTPAQKCVVRTRYAVYRVQTSNGYVDFTLNTLDVSARLITMTNNPYNRAY